MTQTEKNTMLVLVELQENHQIKTKYCMINQNFFEKADVLGGILNTVIPESEAKKAIGNVIQIKGLYTQVISVYLTTTGMYIAVPMFKIFFPTSLLELNSFLDELKNIFCFENLLNENTKLFESAIASRKRKISSIDFDYGTPEHKKPAHSLLNLIKPTYYSPPDSDCFYSAFSLYDVDRSSKSPSLQTIVEEFDVTDVDENGWALLNNGKWFHHETNTTLDMNPYE